MKAAVVHDFRAPLVIEERPAPEIGPGEVLVRTVASGLGPTDIPAAHAAFGGRVPDGVDPVDAAPLTCAGVTTYRAVKVGAVHPSDLVGVFGIGGLGHLALQYARIAGGTVVAVDVVPEKLRLARELG